VSEAGAATSLRIELHHRLEGPEGAPVIAFVNSLGTSLEMWDDQAAELVGRFRILRFDQRGHGASPVPPGPYSVGQLADDLLGLLDRLRIERVHLCGLSLGGAVSIQVAAAAGERVQRLALCCTAPSFPPPEPWQERAAAVRARGMGAVVEEVLERWFSPELARIRPEALRRVEAMLRDSPPEGYAASCEALAVLDLDDRLAAIRASTLVVSGAEDPVSGPERGAVIAAAIPEARQLVIDGARHLANVERPSEFSSALAHHFGGGDG
jgi:3-oxoadipate enol-lactonase